MGDTELMHVNQAEIDWLESQGVPLTVNPETGYKEAFLPAILGLAGAALPSLAPGFAAGLGALGTSAALGGIGAGLGSLIETGDLGQGVMTGLLGYGLGSLGSSLFGGGSDAAASAATESAKAVPTATGGIGATPATAYVPNNGAPTSFLDKAGSWIADNPVKAGLGGVAALGAASDFFGSPGKVPSAGGGKSDYRQLQFKRERLNPGLDPSHEQLYFTPGRFSYAEGGPVQAPDPEEDKAIMYEAVLAIRRQHPKPEAAIKRFLKRFGPEAFEALVEKVQGNQTAQPPAMPQEAPQGAPSAVQGPGDGMSDSIPAQIEGQEPAQLSDGEFVVPADVVSDLGNGSTNAGVAQLQEMLNRVRLSKRGSKQQPQAMNPMEALPA